MAGRIAAAAGGSDPINFLRPEFCFLSSDDMDVADVVDVDVVEGGGGLANCIVWCFHDNRPINAF